LMIKVFMVVLLSECGLCEAFDSRSVSIQQKACQVRW
jgi:hypothetical protein